MALKNIMLRKKIDSKKSFLEDLKRKDEEFAKREAELESAINEAKTEEEENTVSEEVEAFESEKKAHEKQKSDLEEEINNLEEELEKDEKRFVSLNTKTEREGSKMSNRKFFNMTIQERDAFFANQEVKDFLQRMRSLKGQQRAVTGAELLIPTAIFDLIKENISEYSKLYKHVRVRPTPGKARQNIMGAIPEAVWTEVCGAVNELELSFNSVEVDGYKVSGIFTVCNATLEDSDISLSAEIVTALGQAIGLALDKAILYGTGVKMPMGIVTRLTQTEDPSDSKTTIKWVNLSTSNVAVISEKTDMALIKAIIEKSGAAQNKYSNGNMFWAMNRKTHTKLVANSLSVNAAGAVVSGMNKTMPFVGGVIEELSFIPDDVIIGGYGDLYLLAERSGHVITQSEHYKFAEDQTVFKGTARYDGCPVIAEGFVAMNIAGGTVSATAVTFAQDKANQE